MIELEVFLAGRLVGQLSYDSTGNQFGFQYTPGWAEAADAFALVPSLPLKPDPGQTIEAHSRAVRVFFENLLPEGQALEDAASTYGVSKQNVAGLLAVLGQETAGALRILPKGAESAELSEAPLRPLPWAEVSERIRGRAARSFTVWDRRVRLSIAGYQDKLAVYQAAPGEWHLANAPYLASTHILKPEPVNPGLAGMTSNEFVCMRLARAAGLAVAAVQLFHVPEPVLLIERFDRTIRKDSVRRLPAIDGCQALGLPVLSKYERPFGDSRDLAGIRTGASLPLLFGILASVARPAVEKLTLLRWVIFQVLIGNTDAHAKNLMFLQGPGGLTLAPAYDLVAGVLYPGGKREDSYAMAIGDAFKPGELSAFEWANFCRGAGLPPALVRRELVKLATKIVEVLPSVEAAALAEGADAGVIARIREQVRSESGRQLEMAEGIVALARLA